MSEEKVIFLAAMAMFCIMVAMILVHAQGKSVIAALQKYIDRSEDAHGERIRSLQAAMERFFSWETSSPADRKELARIHAKERSLSESNQAIAATNRTMIDRGAMPSAPVDPNALELMVDPLSRSIDSRNRMASGEIVPPRV